MRFTRKGYGRIFTDSEVNIAKIKAIIEETNEDEYDYLPPELIAVDQGYDEVVYNGKFHDIDLYDLLNRCQNEDIPCRIVVAADDQEE